MQCQPDVILGVWTTGKPGTCPPIIIAIGLAVQIRDENRFLVEERQSILFCLPVQTHSHCTTEGIFHGRLSYQPRKTHHDKLT